MLEAMDSNLSGPQKLANYSLPSLGLSPPEVPEAAQPGQGPQAWGFEAFLISGI